MVLSTATGSQNSLFCFIQLYIVLIFSCYFRADQPRGMCVGWSFHFSWFQMSLLLLPDFSSGISSVYLCLALCVLNFSWQCTVMQCLSVYICKMFNKNNNKKKHGISSLNQNSEALSNLIVHTMLDTLTGGYLVGIQKHNDTLVAYINHQSSFSWTYLSS